MTHTLFAGELLERARTKVSESYHFKKGFSRSKQSSSSSSDDTKDGIPAKRMKVMPNQRAIEIKNLTEILESTHDQIRIKRQRLDRAKSVNDFTLCDQLSSSISSLIVDKSRYERELCVLNKKESKSKKYKGKAKAKQDEKKLHGKRSIVGLFNAADQNKSNQPSNSPEVNTQIESDCSTADTVILDSSDDTSPADDAAAQCDSTNL